MAPLRRFSIADFMVLLLLAGGVVALVSTAAQWRSDFSPVTYIDLSAWALPRYVVLSAARGISAYILSLTFALSVGYWAAKSPRAQRILLPVLDVLQTIPVLGFLPGLVLGLIAIFPNTNLGLELAAVIMIFTSQVWNMTFSFYSSVKSVPPDLKEAATIMGLSNWEKFIRLELPFGAVDLSWNSLLSMAGGWFFLTVCEAFTLGDRQFRLPGIGSYMAVAIGQGNTQAMLLGIGAMIGLIMVMDFIIWRPILAWVQRFRFDERASISTSDPLMRIWMKESRILTWIKARYYHYYTQVRTAQKNAGQLERHQWVARLMWPLRNLAGWLADFWSTRGISRAAEVLVYVGVFAGVAWATYALFELLSTLSGKTWIRLLRDTFWGMTRVLLAVALSTLWTVPIGIWIGTSPQRIRVAQPIIQILASFPAPMLYPLALGLFFKLGIGFDLGSMLLMMLGVQWYVLFNVLAGAMKIPQELRYALQLMNAPRSEVWKRLYLPSVFPTLVTGWVVAAGGAWNASIVAEYIHYNGKIYRTSGLGATVSESAAQADFALLAASLLMMVTVVLIFNRAVWERVYRIAQTRYRLDT